MKKKIFYALAFLLAATFTVNGQVVPPPVPPPPPPGLPIDGGIVFLFFSALCYGIVKKRGKLKV